MSAPVRDDRRSLAVSCLLLLAGSGTFWLAGSLTWFSVRIPAAAGGTGVASVTGSEIQPSVTAVAAVLLAAVAATVALSGIARRVLGVVVVLAGVAAGWAAVAAVLTPPSPAALVSARAGLNTGGQPIGTSPVTTSAGPWIAVTAAVLAVAAGVLPAVRERRMARLGARYSAPGTGAPAADPDRATWEQLDEGHDPTVGSTEPLPDPRPGRTGGDL